MLAAVVWQSSLSVMWLRDGALLNTLSENNSIYRQFQTYLPAYHDLAAVWTHAPNYVFLLGGLILLYLGSSLRTVGTSTTQ